MSQRIVQVGVDLVRRKVSSLPGQSADQHRELLQVARGAADAAAVGGCQVDEFHGATPTRGAHYPTASHPSNCPDIRYNRAEGQLAQLVSGPVFSSLFAATRVACDWIVRVSYLTLLAVAFWCHRFELVLGLLVVGQFVSALTEAVRPRTG